MLFSIEAQPNISTKSLSSNATEVRSSKSTGIALRARLRASKSLPSSLLVSASICAMRSRARPCTRVRWTRDRPCLIRALAWRKCFTSPLQSPCTNDAKYMMSSVRILMASRASRSAARRALRCCVPRLGIAARRSGRACNRPRSRGTCSPKVLT